MGKSLWMVVEQVDGGKSQHVHYRGPDRGRAREVAAKQLDQGGKKEITVMRVSAATILRPDDLASSLPRDAF